MGAADLEPKQDGIVKKVNFHRHFFNSSEYFLDPFFSTLCFSWLI